MKVDDSIRSHNEAIWRRGGYRSIYTRLLDIGCFEGLANTPLNSVKVADFSEAVTILSFKNAGL